MVPIPAHTRFAELTSSTSSDAATSRAGLVRVTGANPGLLPVTVTAIRVPTSAIPSSYDDEVAPSMGTEFLSH